MASITLRSSDNVLIKVNADTVRCSNKILSLLEEVVVDDRQEAVIDLPEVISVILEKVLLWACFHKDDHESKDDEKDAAKKVDDRGEWDRNFLDVDPGTLFEIVVAAKYLDIRDLLDISVKKVVGMLRGQTVEQIRENFGIKYDLTPEEENQIRKENEWCSDE